MTKIIYIIMAVLVTNCAKDKNQEDFEKEKRAEEMAKLSSVAGVYSGVLKDREERNLGALSIEFTPSVMTSLTDNTGKSVQIPILKGTITLKGKEKATSHFEKSSFDNDSKSFKTEFSFKKNETEFTKINLNGEFTDSLFVGELDAEGFEENKIRFELEKDKKIEEVHVTNLSSQFSYEATTYFGKTNLQSASSVDLKMSLMEKNLSTEQKWIKILIPIRNMEANFEFDHGTVVFSFTNAEWDLRVKTLKSKTLHSGEVFTLDCNEYNEKQVLVGWDCKIYKSSQGLIMNYHLEKENN